MNQDIKDYLIKVLTAFGQMNYSHKDSPERGILTMSVEVRRELISEGWNLLDKNK